MKTKFKVGDKIKSIKRYYSFDPMEGIVKTVHLNYVTVEVTKARTNNYEKDIHWVYSNNLVVKIDEKVSNWKERIENET